MPISKIHRAAGITAFLIIALFLASTISVELSGSHEGIALVKRTILFVIPLLVIAMATTGASGARLAGDNPKDLAKTKLKRMKVVAFFGVVILIPSAYYLNLLASQGDFGMLFMSVQGLELLAGATNLVLIGMNARDGIRLSGSVSAV